MVAPQPANREPRLIGRGREIATLWHHFEVAADGRAGTVLVAGEPGIGKTRLLEVAAARAARAGALVLRGGASDAEGMPPYLPFLEALGQHVRACTPEELGAQAGPLASILATILPELTVRLGQLSASYRLPPEQARLRLYEAVATFLAAIAAERPLLLVLDDLHWADPASLALLCYVAGHVRSARLLILAAYREGEAEQNPAFERATAELTRQRVMSTTAVDRLAAEDVAALAAEYLGAPLDATAGRSLFLHSEGNPFFAEELLRAWLEAGALARPAGGGDGGAYALTSPGALTLPPSIVSAVRQRLTRLPPEIVELLRTAAIIGRTFDIALLAEAVGQDPEPVEDRLQEAARACLVRPGADGGFAFGHDKIRECLYEELTVSRRRRLHGFIGRALEALPEPADAQRLAELAFHFARSGDRARGAVYAQRAAEHAMHAYAPEEAMAHYRTALDLVDDTDPRRGDLAVSLGEAAMLAGAEQEAVAAFESARTWYVREGDAGAAAQASQRLGQAWWRQEAIEPARAEFETALGLLENHGGAALVSVLVDLGSLLAGNLHQQAAGILHSRRALELAEHLPDEWPLVAASRNLGNLLVRSNDLAAGIPLLEQALALATAADEPVEAAECCAGLASAYFWQGALRQSRDMTMRRLTFARRCHDLYQLRHLSSWLAFLDGFQGRSGEAERRLHESRAVVERLASPEPLAFLQYVRGVLAYLGDDYASAEAHFQEAVTLFRRIGPGALVWHLGSLCLSQAVQGKVAEAQACMEEVEALVATLPEGTMPTADPLTYLSMTALALGDRERLGRYYPKLTVFRGQFHDALIDRLLGEVAALREDWETAGAYLETAEATARREELPWELVRTLEAKAGLALAQGGRGNAARGRELLEEAIELLRRLGNDGEARRLGSRLRTASHPAPRPRLPAGLTPREGEVLHHVAAGRSNREIAEALVLSEKTVEHHLTSTYIKIGADNRAAAAAFAVRHGLA
ncbi:MAG: AAA family ATPase [Chloroflexi bacterium]|nr:AAA family ATPase [Chloroflexota bacterium]